MLSASTGVMGVTLPGKNRSWICCIGSESVGRNNTHAQRTGARRRRHLPKVRALAKTRLGPITALCFFLLI
jgi:hypothetical protein